jgi:SAM-dependent methyltransferase
MTKLHLGCGPDYREGWTNVDAVESFAPDIQHDLEETPWPFADAEADQVLANHVVEHISDQSAFWSEVSRVLSPGGTCTVTVPTGLDSVADPTHETAWTYRTPEFVSSAGPEWGLNEPLTVESRHLRMHGHGPGKILTPLAQALSDRWPLFASSTPWQSGELVVRFRREK